MPIYSYTAISQEEKKVKGELLANYEDEVRYLLEQKNLTALEVKEINKSSTKKIKTQDLLYLTKELRRLISAGLPLYEALLALSEKYTDKNIHYILMDLSDEVKRGSSFSEALQKHEKTFDFLYRSMIKNAEKSGSLVFTLEEIEVLLSRQLDVKKQIITAIMYPSILLGFAIIIMGGLLFFIIPSLFELFEGKSLHPITQLTLNLSLFVNNYKISILIFLITILIFFIWLFKFKSGKKLLYKIISHISFLDNILIKLDIVRFCRSFSTLLKGGVDYTKALNLAGGVIKHVYLKEEIIMCEEKVLEGKSLSSELANRKHFPVLVSRMLAIAEEGGGSSVMLQHITEVYEDEVQKVLGRIAVLAQPILLLIIGAIVGFVVLSVLLPLTDVSSFLSA